MRRLIFLALATCAFALTSCGGDDPAPATDAGTTAADTGVAPGEDAGCVPACDGKQCGSDGCGGECGPGCSGTQTCSAAGQCVASDPCANKNCSGETPTCNPATGVCECEATSCTGGKVCDTATKACKVDLCQDVTCAITGESCDAADGVCKCDPADAKCADTWTCTGTPAKCMPATDPCLGKTCNDATLPQCNPQTGDCQCSGDSCGAGKECHQGACRDIPCGGACTGETPYCNAATNTCECTAEACETAAKICDAASKVCIVDQCVGTACPGETPCNPTNGACECTATSCSAAGKVCDAATKQCKTAPITDPLVACTPPAKKYAGLTVATKYCEARAQVVCDRLASCCVIAGDDQYAVCLAYELKGCEQADLTARITGGVTEVDVAKAKACFDAESAAVRCSTGFSAPECDTSLFLTANSALGEVCLKDLDCTEGFCSRAASTCGGTCTAFAALGATCNATTAKCDPAAAFCDSAGKKCKAFITGATTCASNVQCGPGNYCDGSVNPKVCKAYGLAGEPCDPGNDKCLSGNSCVLGTCVANGTVSAGGDCKPGSSAACAEGLFCDGAAKCVALRADGETCAGYYECQATSDCVATKCTAKQDVGGACVASATSVLTDFGCKFGLSCQGGTCQPQQDVGGTCAIDKDCLRYLRCDAGTKKCVAGGAVGDACTFHAQCTDGYCAGSSSSKPGTCTALAAADAACTANYFCAVGECESNKCRPACTY